MHAMLPLLDAIPFPALSRTKLDTLQVNLGYLCNMTCVHCHVNAGPKRTEIMDTDTIDELIKFMDVAEITTLDLTGGAPEMNPHFRRLVQAARVRDITVIDRCNLTILSYPGYDDLAEFLADNGVEIVASLPCYLEDNVDAQRGKGTFDSSIEALQALNALGYGQADSGLTLNLVYNPQGPSLPPPQEMLEASYKTHLQDHFGIQFNQLFTITNMPIQRFGSTLVSKGQFDDYMGTLQGSHSDDNLSSVMCRSLISIDWQGYVYDCDFNQMLDLPLGVTNKRTHISELSAQQLSEGPIRVAGHCFGCTAGQGSSCGGALDE